MINPTFLLVFTFSVTGFVGAMALLLKLNKPFFKAKSYFILFVIIQSLNIMYAFLILTGSYKVLSRVVQTNHILQLITPVVIYLFSYYLVNPAKKAPKLIYVIILPAIVLLIYLIPFYAQSPEVKIKLQESLMGGYMPFSHKILFGIKMISGMLFMTLALLELRKHEKNLFNFYGEIENKTHQWLRNALVSFLVIWVAAITLRLLFDMETFTIALAIFVGGINWFLLFNFSVHVQPLSVAEEKTEEDLALATGQLASDNTASTELERLAPDLLTKVEEKKCYLNPNCNLTNFAEELGFKTYIVSGILNKVLGTNFYDFINELRAKEAAKMLSDAANNYLKIDAIASECGFKSKATFYKAFKKMYKVTPSQYQKESKNS